MGLEDGSFPNGVLFYQINCESKANNKSKTWIIHPKGIFCNICIIICPCYQKCPIPYKTNKFLMVHPHHHRPDNHHCVLFPSLMIDAKLSNECMALFILMISLLFPMVRCELFETVFLCLNAFTSLSPIASLSI